MHVSIQAVKIHGPYISMQLEKQLLNYRLLWVRVSPGVEFETAGGD